MVDESKEENLSTEAVKVLKVGERLQYARQAMQLSVADVADQLHITVTYVNLIERNQFHKLPGAIFARGYIKLYARLLNLPVDEIMACYFEQSGDSTSECQVHLATNEYGASMRRHAIRWAVAIVVIVLLAPTLGWWYVHNDDSDEVTVMTNEEVLPSPLPTENAEAAVNNNIAISSLAVSEANPSFLLPAATNPTTSVTANTENKVTVTQTSKTALTDSQPSPNNADVLSKSLDITFADKSWIQIKNIDGIMLHDAEHHAGEHITIGGKPPFYVWVKNGKAVTILFNGEPVDINNVDSKGAARLVVGK